MVYSLDLKTVAILGSILGLLLVGLLITLRSGVADLHRSQDRGRLASNFSLMLLRLAGYGAVLLAVQRFIGSPHGLGW